MTQLIKLSNKIIILILGLFLFNSLCINKSYGQWVGISTGMNSMDASALAVSGNNLFAGTFSTGVYLSTNNGTSWNQTSLNNQNIQSLAASGSNVFAGTYYNGLFKSTNNGTTWMQTSLNKAVFSLAINGNNIFAGAYDSIGGVVYKSTDNGVTWFQTSLNHLAINALAFSGNNIIAGTYNSVIPAGVYLSTNNGATWTETLYGKNILSLAVSGNNIYAGTQSYGIYLSTNNGLNWTQTAVNNHDVRSIAVNGSSVFAGIAGWGVFVSGNNGTSWTLRNEGLPAVPYVYSVSIINSYVIATTSDNGVYRRQINELTGVKPISNETPNSFSLSQNYPNPFNPSTKIKFAVPSSGYVTISIFDITGKMVDQIVNGKFNAGVYEADWNASNYPSGTYFYKLQADGFTDTKKMTLVK